METTKLAEAPLVNSITTSNRALVERSGTLYRYQPTYIRNAINLNNKAYLYANAWGVEIPSSSSTTKEGWKKVGNYSLFEAYKAECGRYLMSPDGSKVAKLHSENSALYTDGSSAPVDSNHTMCHFPRLYYYFDGTILWMSQQEIGDKYIEEHWVGAYIGSIVNNKYVSQPNVIPTSQSPNNLHNYAKQNSIYFGLEDYDFRKMLTFLCISEYGSPNAYHHVGVGIAGSSGNASKVFATGSTSILGDASDRIAHAWTDDNSNNVYDACDVSFMGVENEWGTIWFVIQGIYANGTNVYLYKGNNMPTSEELSATPIGNYRTVTRLTSGGLFQYPQCGNGELDIIPKNIGSAGVWSTQAYNTSNGVGFLWGGRGQNCGIAMFNCSNAWNSLGGVSRLAYYSQPNIVEKL